MDSPRSTNKQQRPLCSSLSSSRSTSVSSLYTPATAAQLLAANSIAKRPPKSPASQDPAALLRYCQESTKTIVSVAFARAPGRPASLLLQQQTLAYPQQYAALLLFQHFDATRWCTCLLSLCLLSRDCCSRSSTAPPSLPSSSQKSSRPSESKVRRSSSSSMPPLSE